MKTDSTEILEDEATQPMIRFDGQLQTGICLWNPVSPNQEKVGFTITAATGSASIELTREQARTFAQHVLDTFPELAPGQKPS
jgi:hypothetical protein